MIILVKSSLVLVSLLAFYKFLLEKESFFAANRLYLLTCLGLILLMPFIVLPKIVEHQGFFDEILNTTAISEPTLIVEERNSITDFPEAMASLDNPIACQTAPNNSATISIDRTINEPIVCETTIAPSKAKSFLYWAFWIYIFGVVILSINLLAQIFSVLRLIVQNKDRIEDDGVVIVNMNVETEPCSFFKYVFINPSSYDFETYEQVLNHEKIHAQQWHSADLLFSEIVGIILWFNPFIWLFRKEVEKNIEYQTDDILVNKSVEVKKEYQLNLVKIACKTSPLAITTNYNQSLIKQRIMRMNSKKSNSFSYWKYVFSLPLLFVLLLSLNNPLYSISDNTVNLGDTYIPTDTNNETQEELSVSNNNRPETISSKKPALSEKALADCAAFEAAVAKGDLAKVKEILKTLDPDCLNIQLKQSTTTPEVQQLMKARQKPIQATVKEITITEKTTTTITEDESPCKKVKRAVDERDINTLKNVLLYEDVSCLDDPDGNPSDDIELIKILLKYNAHISIDRYGIVNISEINFIINADQPKNRCNDPNYLDLSEAIRAKDESRIRKILSTKNLTCPLSVDGVTNDFIYIKKMMQYKPEIINQDGEEISVGGLGMRIDLENKLKEMSDYERQRYQNQSSSFVPLGDAEQTCLSLIEAILVGEDFLAKEILKTVEPNCFHRETHTQKTDGHSHSTTKVNSPLIAAIRKDNVSMARSIIEAGADVNYVEEKDDAPLLIAVKSGNLEIVKLLVENDVHLNYEDQNGQTALDYAIDLDHKKVIDFLNLKGAK